MDEDLILFPGNAHTFITDKAADDTMHPVSVRLLDINGKLTIIVKNEHKDRVLKLPADFDVLKFIGGSV